MRRVLIVEGNADEVPLIRDFCIDVGFEVAIVKGGIAVVEAAQGMSPNLILIDISAQLFDGLSTTIQLRALKNANNEQLTIIGLNGDSSAVSAACRVAGMNQILTAPLQPKRLLAALRSVQVPLNFLDQEPKEEVSYLDTSERALQRMAEAFGPLSVETPFARIYFPNFHRLKILFGDSWDDVSEHIEAVTRAIIERHLGENVVYKRLDELDFLLMGPGQTEDICGLRSQSIVSELCRELATDKAGTKFQVRYVSFFGKASAHEQNTSERPVQANPASFINPDILPWARLNFWPVWDTELRKFSIRTVRADRDTEGALLPEAIEAIQRDGHDSYFVAIDISTIADLVGRLDGYETLEPPRILGLPVHFHTLENYSSAHRFLYYLEQIPKRIRERLIIEMHGVLNEMLVPQIVQCQKTILAYCLHTMIVVPPAYDNFNVLKKISNQIVGIELAETEAKIEQEIEALQYFSTTAKRYGLTMGASIVRNRRFRDWGMTFCRYASGPMIAPAQTHLRPGAKLIGI